MLKTQSRKLRKQKASRKAAVRLPGLDPRKECDLGLQWARALYDKQQWDEALAEVERVLAVASAPAFIARNEGRDSAVYALECYRLRAECNMHLGRMDEHVAEMKRILEIIPDAQLHHRMLFNLNHLSGMTPELLLDEARRWNDLYAAPLENEIRPHANNPDPERRLKIGYVSPDLYNHALIKLIAPVLERHDRSQFAVHVYSLGSKSDFITENLRRNLEHFVDLEPSRTAIVERVRADEIDILVDLVGHTMPSVDAYLAFAVKPAPIQVSWLGVMSTTGLSTMDYFLGDPYLPHPETDHAFSEVVYRIPRISACYRPFGALTSLAPSPYFKNGYITFGCFNHPRKVTREAVKLWAAILHLVPDSRLLFKFVQRGRRLMQEQFWSWFAEDGIARERICFEDASLPVDYLHCWGKVDVALDTFPYTGGTTTFDALWMGVPVVSLYGRLTVHCSGTAILGSAGLPVAETPQQYIELALCLAETVMKEPSLRSRIREAFRRSPNMDEIGLVRCVEAAYRDMWRTWCKTKE